MAADIVDGRRVADQLDICCHAGLRVVPVGMPPWDTCVVGAASAASAQWSEIDSDTGMSEAACARQQTQMCSNVLGSKLKGGNMLGLIEDQLRRRLRCCPHSVNRKE